jgi:hypothetical protein
MTFNRRHAGHLVSDASKVRPKGGRRLPELRQIVAMPATYNLMTLDAAKRSLIHRCAGHLYSAGGRRLPKMVKMLHKITAKMAKTLGLDQNDENQSKNSQKRTQKARGDVKMTKLRLKTTKCAKNHTFKNREILSYIHLF